MDNDQKLGSVDVADNSEMLLPSFERPSNQEDDLHGLQKTILSQLSDIKTNVYRQDEISKLRGLS